MKKTRTDNCIELLAGATEPLDDAQLAASTGLSAAYLRRLRANPEFIAEVNSRAKQLFLAQMPAVLAALADAAADGKNASAMKLFIDACRAFELSAGAEDGGGDADAFIQRLRDAGIELDEE